MTQASAERRQFRQMLHNRMIKHNPAVPKGILKQVAFKHVSAFVKDTTASAPRPGEVGTLNLCVNK